MPGFEDNLQHMPSLHFSVFALVTGGIAAWCFYLIWRNFRRARVVEDTPTARVRSAPQGYVELQGQARALPDQPVTAPLTGTLCVWYRFRIERETSGSRSGSRWVEVESGSSETAFVLSDGTGDCLVDPRRAEVTAALKKTWYGRSKWPGRAAHGGLLGLLTGGRYRYTEERIEGGGDVYVLGWFDSVRSTDAPVGEEVSALLRDWKRDRESLLRRFDADGDGDIDAREWQAAQHEAQSRVLADRARRSAQPALHRIGAGVRAQMPYLISAYPQSMLSGRYRRQALLALCGSLLSVSLLAWMLAARWQ